MTFASDKQQQTEGQTRKLEKMCSKFTVHLQLLTSRRCQVQVCLHFYEWSQCVHVSAEPVLTRPLSLIEVAGPGHSESALGLEE